MFAPLFILGTFFAILIIHFLVKDWNRRRKYAHIPGPPGLPIIGNIHQLDKKKPFNSVAEWSKAYGPLIKVNFLGRIYLFAVGYEAVREVLDTKGKEFGGRERNYRTNLIDCNAGIVRMDYDNKLKVTRRLLHSSVKAFGPGLNRLEHYAMQVSEEFIRTFEATKCTAVDPLDTIFNATLRMISLMVFGRKIEENSDVFHHVKQYTVLSNETLHIGNDGPQLDLFPWLRFFGNKTYKTLLEIRSHIGSIWHWYKTEIAPLEDSELEDKLGRPFCKVMNDHNASCEVQEVIPENEMRAHAHHVIFAGILTTTTTLYKLILYTLNYPKIKERMMQEIDDIIGTRMVTLNDRAKMPYINAVLHETLRYSASGPIGLPHKAMEDAEIMGYMVPKGTTVFAHLTSVLRDESFFSDACQFHPERFLDDKGELLPADHEIWRHTIPFGAGPRVCSGQLFAQYRLFLWTVTLFQRFDIIADPENPPSSPKYEDFDLKGVSLLPKCYKAKFIPRYAV